MSLTPDSTVTPNPAALNFRTVDVRGQHLSLAGLRAAVPRAQAGTMADAEDRVLDIIRRPHAGLRRTPRPGTVLRRRRTGAPPRPAEALRAALADLDPAVRAALEESILRARRFADAQRPADIDVELGEGAVVSQNWVPVARVGLYVPGGLAVYPSSVIMNVVPALAAGVESIALALPAAKEFRRPPAPHNPGGGLPAGDRGGLRDRRGAGHRRLRLRYSPRRGRRRESPGSIPWMW